MVSDVSGIVTISVVVVVVVVVLVVVVSGIVSVMVSDVSGIVTITVVVVVVVPTGANVVVVVVPTGANVVVVVVVTGANAVVVVVVTGANVVVASFDPIIMIIIKRMKMVLKKSILPSNDVEAHVLELTTLIPAISPINVTTSTTDTRMHNFRVI